MLKLKIEIFFLMNKYAANGAHEVGIFGLQWDRIDGKSQHINFAPALIKDVKIAWYPTF